MKKKRKKGGCDERARETKRKKICLIYKIYNKVLD